MSAPLEVVFVCYSDIWLDAGMFEGDIEGLKTAVSNYEHEIAQSGLAW